MIQNEGFDDRAFRLKAKPRFRGFVLFCFERSPIHLDFQEDGDLFYVGGMRAFVRLNLCCLTGEMWHEECIHVTPARMIFRPQDNPSKKNI